jgi:hypothetical protein
LNRNEDESDDDAKSVDSSAAFMSTEESLELFRKHGQTDCVVIAGGRLLLAHRAILAHRSPEFREMIETESFAMNASTTLSSPLYQPPQILLPQLNFSTAKALLYFLYTDVLSRQCLSDLTVLQSLAKVAMELKLVSRNNRSLQILLFFAASIEVAI